LATRLARSDAAFSYYLPHEALSAHVAYYSIQHVFSARIAPLFTADLGGSVVMSRSGPDIRTRLWGPFDETTTVEDPALAVQAQCFVEFHPGGLSRLVHPDSRELLNRKIDLGALDRGLELRLTGAMEDSAGSAAALVSALDDCLLDRLERHADRLARGRGLLAALQHAPLAGTVEGLAREVCYSPRQVNRYLHALTGVSGKAYLRLRRLGRGAGMLKSSGRTVERIALSLGYYDTAHFVHDFVKYAGLSPSRYRNNLSGFYNDSLKRF
jgi:AraC-like DNA-binding protein